MHSLGPHLEQEKPGNFITLKIGRGQFGQSHTVILKSAQMQSIASRCFHDSRRLCRRSCIAPCFWGWGGFNGAPFRFKLDLGATSLCCPGTTEQIKPCSNQRSNKQWHWSMLIQHAAPSQSSRGFIRNMDVVNMHMSWSHFGVRLWCSMNALHGNALVYPTPVGFWFLSVLAWTFTSWNF